MSNPSYVPLPNQAITIISSRYCTANRVELFIVRKLKKSTDIKFSVSDEMGTIIFKLKPVSSKFFHGTYLLLDDADNPLITIRRKMRTTHKRHEVYRGNSCDSKDLLFSVRKSSLIRNMKSKLVDVFLASNQSEKVCDFKIQGNWSERSCAVHLGESPTIVAQMDKKNAVTNAKSRTEAFTLTVYPYVDKAFIVALIVIRGQMKDTD